MAFVQDRRSRLHFEEKRLVHRYLQQKGIPAVLAYYIHPWEFWPMKTSYHFGEATVIPDEFITKNCGPIALVELEKQIDGLARMGAEFVTARDLAKLFA